MKSFFVSLIRTSVIMQMLLTAVSIPVFAGGGVETPGTAGNTPAAESAEGYPVIISHAFGETRIEAKPERIAAIAWANQDVPLALGVVPVGVSMANYGVLDGGGLLPWTREGFEALGENDPVIFNDLTGLDYEAIADVQPDVILAAYSGITREEYQLLSQIAPVVAYPSNPWQTYWRDQILMDSAGMGMAQEGKALVAELEALIGEKTSAYPELRGKTAAFFWFNPADMGNFYLYLPSDPRAAYLEDLGLEVPVSVQEIAESETSFAVALSAENADLLYDIDIIISYGSDALLEALQADPLLGRIPAVSRASVAIIPDATPLAASGTPSPLSIPWAIDAYLEIIAAAARRLD